MVLLEVLLSNTSGWKPVDVERELKEIILEPTKQHKVANPTPVSNHQSDLANSHWTSLPASFGASLAPPPNLIPESVYARFGIERIRGFPSAQNAELEIYVYRLTPETNAVAEETVEDETDGTRTAIFEQHVLPSPRFEGVWESLILPTHIPDRLLAYASTSLLFGDLQVDPRAVTCNRVVLLHGPPGTGKTSLCQGFAQKLAVRLGSRRYPNGAFLLEVNTHSLFSRWFSESGKLVARMFERVRELASDPQSLVLVLVDEVESLAAARKSNGADPSDAIRVVNALLTQIDKLRTIPNVLVLATSNLTQVVDEAFLDRADLRIHLGPPTAEARYQILRSSFVALTDAGVVSPWESIDLTYEDAQRATMGSASRYLAQAAQESSTLSGRALRKLPMIAHAFHVRVGTATPTVMAEAMMHTVREETIERGSRSADDGVMGSGSIPGDDLGATMDVS